MLTLIFIAGVVGVFAMLMGLSQTKPILFTMGFICFLGAIYLTYSASVYGY